MLILHNDQTRFFCRPIIKRNCLFFVWLLSNGENPSNGLSSQAIVEIRQFIDGRHNALREAINNIVKNL